MRKGGHLAVAVGRRGAVFGAQRRHMVVHEPVEILLIEAIWLNLLLLLLAEHANRLVRVYLAALLLELVVMHLLVIAKLRMRRAGHGRGGHCDCCRAKQIIGRN